MKCSTEQVFLPIQRLQLEHDQKAHQDILGLDVYTRLKHMVLHFYKYTGKVYSAHEKENVEELRKVLVDTFIICLASANTLNISLGDNIKVNSSPRSINELANVLSENMLRSEDVFSHTLNSLITIGGKMAKAMESCDHMESGNPRVEMTELVIKLTISVLVSFGKLRADAEKEVKERFLSVERKSIFWRDKL